MDAGAPETPPRDQGSSRDEVDGSAAPDGALPADGGTPDAGDAAVEAPAEAGVG